MNLRTSIYIFQIIHENNKKIDVDIIIESIKKHCSGLGLRRFEESESTTELSLLVEIKNYESLKKIKQELHKIDNSIYLTFIDNVN